MQVNDSAYFLQTESSIDVSAPHKKVPFSESFVNGGPVSSANLLKMVNPLEDTHEFRQACQLCFTKAGRISVNFWFFFLLQDHHKSFGKSKSYALCQYLVWLAHFTSVVFNIPSHPLDIRYAYPYILYVIII